MFRLAVFNIQHLNSNREDFFAFIFFLCIKLQETLIKIQRAHISKSYLKFRHMPELSHSVDRGINGPSKAPSCLFFVKPPENCPIPFFGNSSYNFFLVNPLPKNW